VKRSIPSQIHASFTHPSPFSSCPSKSTDLHAQIPGREILKGLNLTINPGEVHAIMGPNGSAKAR
jgi:ABC-type molybdenum transport system ATPase subunit/photorepair protein PhrA